MATLGYPLPMGATRLWLVRHGESVANLAMAAAEIAGQDTFTVGTRDADVPLTITGRQQARALGRWLAQQCADGDSPTVWSSPYLRAEQTASIAVESSALSLPLRLDERLRDREPGALGLLTERGIETRYPAEAERRRREGPFRYRPPGGESWADVARRVQSFLHDADVAALEGTLLVVAHDTVVMLFVSLCLGLEEQQLADFARVNTVTNASVTRLDRAPGSETWHLRYFSSTKHLSRFDAAGTDPPRAGDG